MQVWSLLDKGAYFYVCGDAGSMAGAVEKALLGIIAKQVTRVVMGDCITDIMEFIA